jgi:hypothetical protein
LQTLAIDCDYADAMSVAADAYLGLAMWSDLAAIAEKLLQKCDNDVDRIRPLEFRAQARLELGDREAAMRDVEELAQGSEWRQRRAKRFKCKLLDRIKEIEGGNAN